MPHAIPKPCTVPGCSEVVHGGGRCIEHRRAAERRRGSSSKRGYDSQHEVQFRQQVLGRQPICVLCRRAMATQADHHPLSRRQLQDKNLNPNDPRYGRGLCASCHSKETAKHQPGGFNQR